MLDALILDVWRTIRTGFIIRGDPRAAEPGPGDRLFHVLPVSDPDRAEELAVDAFRATTIDRASVLARLQEIEMSGAITVDESQLAEAEDEGREPAAITLDGDFDEARLIAEAEIVRLGPECVAVAAKRFREGKSIPEAARELNIGRSAVKARERRIRFHVKHVLRVRFQRRFGDASIDHLISRTGVPPITIERIQRRIVSRLQPSEPRPYHERARWAFGALFLAVLALVLLAIGQDAFAKPPATQKSPDAEVLDVTKRAEGLLDKLEYERARELLESSVRTLPAYKKAKMPAKAKLWVLLGRARAELGDMVGGDEAFLKAVGFDKRVKLTASASPKILEALERARANAPSAAEVAEPEEPEPVREPPREKEPLKETPPKVVKETPKKEPKPPKEAPKEPAKETPKVAVKETPKVPPKEAVKERAKEKEKPKEPKPLPVVTGPVLRHRVVGEVKDGRTITVVIEHENLPKNSKLELLMRRGQTSPFKAETLTKTGTVAVKKITLDRPRVELYARATKSKKTIAQIGSENDPIVITTLPTPPLLVEAWSTRDERPSFIKTSSTSTTSPALAGELRTNTSSTALVPPTKVTAPKDDGDDTVLIALGVGAGAVVVAGAIILTVILLNGGGDDCDAEEGFGCTAIEIVPLVSF